MKGPLFDRNGSPPFPAVYDKRGQDQDIADQFGKAEAFPRRHDPQNAGRKRIDDRENGSLLCKKIFLSHRLKGKAEAAAQQDQKQHQAPLRRGVRQPRPSRPQEGRRQAERPRPPELEHHDRQRVRLLRHLLGDDNENGIGKRGEDDQKHAHPAAGGLRLRQGKKPDADHGESSAEHGLLPRTGPGHDRREDGDQNDRHVFDQGTDAAVDATEPEHFKDHDGGAQDAEDQAAA